MREMDEVIELTKGQLKEIMYSSWINGMLSSPRDIDKLKNDFEHYYENGLWETNEKNIESLK